MYYSTVLMYHGLFNHSIVYGYLGCFRYFELNKKCCNDKPCKYVFLHCWGISSGWILTSGTAGSNGKCKCSFIAYCHIPFCKGCTSFHSHQQYVSAPPECWSSLLTVADLIGDNCYRSVVLIYIYFIMSWTSFHMFKGYSYLYLSIYHMCIWI